MKKNLLFRGILTLMLIFSLGLMACPPEEDTKEPPVFDPEESLWLVESIATGQTVSVKENVDTDGKPIAKITIAGTAQPESDYLSRVGYLYTDIQPITKGKQYKFVFEAWTETGERKINIEPFFDGFNNYYYHVVSIDNTKRHTIEYITPVIPDYAEDLDKHSLSFFCADTIGTFYVKIISVTETQGEEPTFSPRRYWTSGDHLTYTATADDVVTVTVSELNDNLNQWDAAIGAWYGGKKGFRAKFKFKVWTEETSFYITSGYHKRPFSLSNDSNKVYEYITEPLSDNDQSFVFFGLENGTFKFKIISIERTDEDPTFEEPMVIPWIYKDPDFNIITLNKNYNYENETLTLTIGNITEGMGFPVHIGYDYDGQVGTAYKYKFSIWVDDNNPGNNYPVAIGYETLIDGPQWDFDNANQESPFMISDDEQTYEFTGDLIHVASSHKTLKFRFKNNGTYNIKFISIEPAE